MREQSTDVATSAHWFDKAKQELGRTSSALRQDLYDAFRKLCPVKAGDRIQVSFGKDRFDGRAVILLDGTRMGLYVDVGGQRHAVPQPYAENVRKLKR